MSEKDTPIEPPPTISRGAALAHGCCGGLHPAAIFQDHLQPTRSSTGQRDDEPALRLVSNEAPPAAKS